LAYTSGLVNFRIADFTDQFDCAFMWMYIALLFADSFGAGWGYRGTQRSDRTCLPCNCRLRSHGACCRDRERYRRRLVRCTVRNWHIPTRSQCPTEGRLQRQLLGGFLCEQENTWAPTEIVSGVHRLCPKTAFSASQPQHCIAYNQWYSNKTDQRITSPNMGSIRTFKENSSQV